MAGRALAFSDPQIIRLAKEQFVPVACDDWYQRRRQDAEGKFFRSVAEQGPRAGENGATCQGIYMLTAGGRLLFYRNAGQSAEATLDALEEALRKWEQLPADERAPGAVKVEDAGELDGGYARKPPPGGMIVNVFTRALDDEPAAGAKPSTVCKLGAGREAARDHLWITKEEAASLVPSDAQVGQSFAMPKAIAHRILRFHLVDNTRGEPPLWRTQDIRRSDLKLTVAEATADAIMLRLDGSALLSTDADPDQAARGYDVSLLGELVYDRHKPGFSRFDVVAFGNHWGEGKYTPGARPGRQPLGVVFQLANGRGPGDSVPPQGAREIDEYFGTGR